MRIGILGGGISGLTLQHCLTEDSEILEAAPVPGGLCRTFWKDGFGYDIGGHILFSKHKHVTALVEKVLGENIHQIRRENKILYNGRYVKYPFENDLAALDVEDRYDCLIHYLKNDWQGTPANLAEWCYATFGRGIADRYLLPYNRKIWKTEPEEIGVEWVERIPKPPVEDVVKSALGISTEGYTHQLYPRYPLRGGFESLIKALNTKPARLLCERPVRAIRKTGAMWTVHAGAEERSYDRLVVAFPLHEAVRCMEHVPAEVESALGRLRFNAIRVALVAVDDTSLSHLSAVYIPDPEVIPHRVCFMSFFSPNMAPPGSSCLVAETTVRPGSDLDQLSDDNFLARVISDLDRIGIIREKRVVARETRRFRYAYPVYDLGYSRDVQVVRAWFKSLGIDLLGRFAEFDYVNSDECMHRAMKLAEELNARV